MNRKKKLWTTLSKSFYFWLWSNVCFSRFLSWNVIYLTRAFVCLQNCCLKKKLHPVLAWNQGCEILENCNSLKKWYFRTMVLKLLDIFFSGNPWFTSWFNRHIPYNCYLELPCLQYLEVMKNYENGKNTCILFIEWYFFSNKFNSFMTKAPIYVIYISLLYDRVLRHKRVWHKNFGIIYFG